MDINQKLQKVIKDVEILGYELYPIQENIKLTNGVKTYGCCKRNTRTNICRISISKYLRDEDLMNTLYHEVLHAIKGAKGHGKLWQKAAKDVEKHYGYKITRCSNRNLYNEDGKKLKTEDLYRYKIVCPHCGHEYKYMRKTNGIKNPQDYSCGICHHKKLESYTINGLRIK